LCQRFDCPFFTTVTFRATVEKVNDQPFAAFEVIDVLNIQKNNLTPKSKQKDGCGKEVSAFHQYISIFFI
jgi:hypothetical protein